MPHILIRADAGPGAPGMGHIVRSSSLAEEAIALGCSLQFICKQYDSSARTYLKKQNIPCKLIPSELSLDEEIAFLPPADIILVDSYDISSHYLKCLSALGKLALVSDYFLPFELPVDLLINFQFAASELEYRIPESSLYLAGPEYFPFRSQFQASTPPTRVPRVENILVFFGGYDEHNMTQKAVEALHNRFLVTALIGPSYPQNFLPELKNTKARILSNVHDMVGLLDSVDLTVCQPSTFACESASRGLPSISFLLADNQIATSVGLEKAGASISLGDYREFSEVRLLEAAEQLRADREQHQSMSKASKKLFDCQGSKRIARELVTLAS